MKITKLEALACALTFCLASAAEAATLSGSPAFALAAIAAAHSPTLSAAEKKEVAAIFNGKGSGSYKGKIVISADKIDCRISNVDITSRSCELTFGSKTASFTGREANELYSTEAMAGVPSDGAAGSIHEAVAKLKCTLDPKAIKQNDGSGADCSYEAP
ncbi:MAG TPA: hypothetical protein VNY08_04590 [Bradyrhizobium sp.]|jgi:hypothetical protein|nr:hypothetical protein [Bradyrhizobium sp.]